MRNRLGAVLAVLLLALVARPVAAAGDASVGYETIRPSLVKVWAFDSGGRPTQSGSGVVVASNDRRSLVLTATHVVAGAAAVRIDISRDLHDLVAHVERTGPRDLTLLAVDRGGLRVARFAARDHAVVEGNLIAVAGYVKNDELIGVVGQEPRVLFPGTIASRPENGTYLELENLHVEEGLSGGPVFDPATGEVLGIVTSRTSDRRGGFADSAALVVQPFLAAVAAPPAAPAPRAPVAVVTPRPLPVATPAPLPAFAPRPRPNATLQASVAFVLDRPVESDIVSWHAGPAQTKRFAFERDGCNVAVTVDIRALQFVVAHQALVAPRHRGALFTIALSRSTEDSDSCDDIDDADPASGAYEPTAMAFDGHHVTMRFVYAGDRNEGGLFPSDASLDADLDGDHVTATVQLFDRDWSGTIAVPLARTALAAISSTW